MQLTTKKLKQLIREALLKEASREDLEFLRDVRYSKKLKNMQRPWPGVVYSTELQRVLDLYKQAQETDDVVILQYIDNMNIWEIKSLEYSEEDKDLVTSFFSELENHQFSFPVESKINIDKADFAKFIEGYLKQQNERPRRARPQRRLSRPAAAEAERLWWLLNAKFRSSYFPSYINLVST